MPEVFAGRYRLIDELGRGSNGIVWRCFDENLNREVALKRFRPDQQSIVAYTEAGLLTQLASDHILKVSNADTFDDIPYIATDVAASTAEHELALAPHGLSPDVVLRWARHVLVGLSVTHHFGLVHRDLKPANVFLDADGRALLGDFGLARLDRGAGVPVAGTPRIRAPEMFDTGVGDVRSDIYALGVSLYRLLTGEWPFEYEAQVLRGSFARLRTLAPHVPRRLADRVERAMKKDPALRYRSADEMNDELGRTGLLPRTWQRAEPHPGHERCWREHGRQNGGFTVCALGPGPSYSIEVRRSTATTPRVHDLCATGIRERDLGKALARTFDAIAAGRT